MNVYSRLASCLFLAGVLHTHLYGQRIRVGGVAGGDTSKDFSEMFRPSTPSQAGYEQTAKSNGYAIGPSLQVQLWPRLSFEIDALFKPLRFTQATVLPDGSRRSVSPATVVTWQFPLLLKYHLRESGLSPFVVGGPSVRTAGNLNGTNPSSTGATAGAGLTIPWKAIRIEPAVRYTRWRADPPGASPVRTQPDQFEFLLGVTAAGTNSSTKPLHPRVSVGAVFGAAVTDRRRDSAGERRFLAGPQLGLAIKGPLSLLVNPLYSPIGRNVTWEFPILARYSALSPASRVRPILEAGPAFRTPQEINGSKLGRYGVAAGGGLEIPAGPVHLSTVLRHTYWAPESNPSRSLVHRGQWQLLAGFAF